MLRDFPNCLTEKTNLQTRTDPNPIRAFCTICRDRGYAIYEMDLAMAGEEFYAEIKRSTNGGGENSPALEGEDDFYELFLAALVILKIKSLTIPQSPQS